jgi:RNA-binding protein PNO1
MPAPTALQRRPEEFIEDATKDVEMDASAIPLPIEDDSELVDMSIDAAPVPNEPTQAPEDISMTDESGRPKFAPSTSVPLAFKRESRKVPIPPHRMSPLKTAWYLFHDPVVDSRAYCVAGLKSIRRLLSTSSFKCG